MSGLTLDGTVEPVSRDQILRRERRQEKKQKTTVLSGNHIYPVDKTLGCRSWLSIPQHIYILYQRNEITLISETPRGAKWTISVV